MPPKTYMARSSQGNSQCVMKRKKPHGTAEATRYTSFLAAPPDSFSSGSCSYATSNAGALCWTDECLPHWSWHGRHPLISPVEHQRADMEHASRCLYTGNRKPNRPRSGPRSRKMTSLPMHVHYFIALSIKAYQHHRTLEAVQRDFEDDSGTGVGAHLRVPATNRD